MVLALRGMAMTRWLLLGLLVAGCATKPQPFIQARPSDPPCLKEANLNHGVLIKGYYVPGDIEARKHLANRKYFSTVDYDQFVLGARCASPNGLNFTCVNPCGSISGYDIEGDRMITSSWRKWQGGDMSLYTEITE